MAIAIALALVGGIFVVRAEGNETVIPIKTASTKADGKMDIRDP